MNANTLTTSFSIDPAVVPDWLQECLNCRSQPDAGPNPNCSNDNSLICRAFEFARDLHEGQYRKSGEPYICHPVAVAGILRYMGGNNVMIAAGFLHDIVEDTDITLEEIEQRFGAEVRQLVEGVTKLSSLIFPAKQSAWLKISAECSWQWLKIFASLSSNWQTGCTT